MIFISLLLLYRFNGAILAGVWFRLRLLVYAIVFLREDSAFEQVDDIRSIDMIAELLRQSDAS